MPRQFEIIIPENVTRERLDVYLSHQDLGLSRSYIQHLVQEGHIRVNTHFIRPSHKITTGDKIELNVPEPENIDIIPEDIPVDVVYEDDQLAVINKPTGMVVHPACGNYSGTLVHALLFRFADLSGINGVQRPGIVHRLDKVTSGLMLVAKTDKAHHSLSSQLKHRTLTRKYWAVVNGVFHSPEGFIETQLARDSKDRKKVTVVQEGGRMAGTHYHQLEQFQYKMGSELMKFGLVECQLTTGRTHQIRVHMSYLGHPVMGDMVYGPSQYGKLTRKFTDLFEKSEGCMLHAREIQFIHPVSGELKQFIQDPPAVYQEVLSILRG